LIQQNKKILRRANNIGTNLGAAESEGGQKFIPPNPFLFARPSVQFGARSAPSVPFKKGSDFVKQTHPNCLNNPIGL